jgi:hypothetical protein
VKQVCGDVKPCGILVQYVEGLKGETARRIRVFALAAEPLMNNAGHMRLEGVDVQFAPLDKYA